VPISTTHPIPERPDQLDNYLHIRESRFSNIRENCEKKIVWHGKEKAKTALAVVYIHGFSASRMETWPLCNRLAASLGANLFYTRLSGHGQDGAALGAARVEDWLIDGLEAVIIGSRLATKIILVGTSTGATLATWLAAQPSVAPLIESLILISPNFFPKNPLAAAALCPLTFRLLERFFGGWRSFSVVNAAQARYWTIRYPLRAIATMMQLVRRAWQVDLKNAAMPVLMMVNPWDRVINVSLAVIRYLAFPACAKRLALFTGNKDPGRHVLAGEILAPEGTGKVLALIQAFLKTRSAPV
jgi:pimeloyl-ACP methyl ester carboxylesterase